MKQGRIRLQIIQNYQTDEWQVLVYTYKGGAFRINNAATYFTDDKQDAIDTRDAMIEEYEAKDFEVTLR